MTRQVVWILFFVSCILSVVVLWASTDLRWPGDNTGYAPEQPIAFSHRLHAGEMGIDCLYCHTGAETSRHAGIPAPGLCMNCHKTVRAPIADVRAEAAAAQEAGRDPRPVISPEIQKIYDALALGKDLKRDPSKTPTGLAWVKVHDMPDFVYFNHARHVTAGVDCAECHGAIETMDRVVQVSDLSMGFCVNCHRDVNDGNQALGHSLYASTDCVGCHY